MLGLFLVLLPQPWGGPPTLIRPARQVLIAPLPLRLDDPRARAALAWVRRSHPAWKVGRATYAGLRDLPEPVLVLRCQVVTAEGSTLWEVVLRPAADGRFQERSAVPVG